jgi:hypothetical protein
LSDTKSLKRSKKETPRPELISRVLRDGTILESLFDEALLPRCRFVVKEPEREPYETQEYVVNGVMMFPPERLSRVFESGIVKMASGLEDYGTTESLLAEIKAFLHRYIDLQEFEISLLAHWAMMTYCFDVFRNFPYLCFRGEPNSGKSRSLETMASICYRSVDTGTLTTKSALFRLNDQFRSTMVCDEADHAGDLRSDLMKLFNAGYALHGSISISVPRDDDWVPQSYKVGSPKCIANRLPFPDKATETRMLTIPMLSKSVAGHIPAELPRTFEAESQTLRNKLMKWRIETRHQIRKDEAPLKGLDGRAQQLGLPIYSLSPDPAFKKQFLKYLWMRSKELRQDDPLHVVLEAILRLHASAAKSDSKISLASIRVVVRDLAREREMPESEFTSRRLAELVRALQFRTSKWSAGVVVSIDERTLANQAKRFGLSAGNSNHAVEVTHATHEKGEQETCHTS